MVPYTLPKKPPRTTNLIFGGLIHALSGTDSGDRTARKPCLLFLDTMFPLILKIDFIVGNLDVRHAGL